MHKSLVLMPAIATLFLAACATSQPAAPPPAATGSGAPESIIARYMRVVNASATANNAEVHWVNIPDENDLARYTEEE